MFTSNFFDKCLEIREGVGDSIGKINFFIWLFKVVGKLKLIGFLIKSIPTISLNKDDIRAGILGPLSISSAPNEWFHSFHVKISSFGHIADIDSYITCRFICDFKKVPIGVSFGVGITSDEAIILIFFNLDCHI